MSYGVLSWRGADLSQFHTMRMPYGSFWTGSAPETLKKISVPNISPTLGYFTWERTRISHARGLESLFLHKETVRIHKSATYLMELESMQQEVKNIMFWNPGKAARSPLDFQDCEFSACAMTTYLRKADVLWLDVNSLKFGALPPRPPNQIWIFGSRDPPDLPMFDHLDRTDLNNQVNWTWYLLRGSTWQARYGHLQERPLPRKQYNEIFRRKTHNVAWFVSQCERPSRRMEYVKRMRTQVDVHVYGLCGNFTCGSSGYHMGNKREECLNMLSRNYK
ncbi:glycoprotein 3-alpha-L-fucosyltransferase A-like [Elysia marginata]|uniref:Fucosyltransferase n=1 Tax=Elysia marginata TaxID=1093978 RepID=A0AAV4FGM4_9GAST|nr:glycoprotein 3-alpha-L-fucosyltransferase A-like [Elysia marginata]